MSTYIHPQAIVAKNASLGEGVRIGAYATIGEGVVIGRGTVVDSFAQVLGNTTVGENCRIFSYAVVGNIPQDLKYKGGKSYLIIGNNNRIREFVTINPGTEEGSKTIIGDNNLFMAYSHIAHDCAIGNNNVFANVATLAGYVKVEDNVVIGGLVAIHQFCRLGKLSIIGGCSKVVQDIPPFSLCDGHPANLCGVNLVGLKRAGFSSEAINKIKKAFKIIFFQKHPLSFARKQIEESFEITAEIKHLIDFISSTQRGIVKVKERNSQS